MAMGKPQPKFSRADRYGNIATPGHSAEEPARPIEQVHGEVAAMQMLIASRFSHELPARRPEGLADDVERLVSTISRMSGYVFMALAIAGLALLIF
jgi:hypothetical protein